MDYTTMSKSGLIALCKERKIKGYSGKSHDDLVSLVQGVKSQTQEQTQTTAPLNFQQMNTAPGVRFALGHCVPLLRGLVDESVRTVYLDPPFDSDRNYLLSVDSTVGFKDKWEGGEYEKLIRDVLDAAYPKLMKDGTLFFHISAECSFLVHKLLLEKFKYVSMIFWKRCRSKNNVKNKLGATIDIIFKCSKVATPLFHVVFQEKDAKYLANSFKNKDERGNYALGHLVTEATKAGHKYDFTIGGRTFAPTAGWRIPREDLEALAKENRLHVPKGANAKLYKKIYLSENPGKPCTDLWDDIHSIGQGSEERKYPTAKPQKLLERILSISSNPGDLVCDPMCGSGTTGAAATLLGRRCILFDCNPDVLPIVQSRFQTNVSTGSATVPVAVAVGADAV